METIVTRTAELIETEVDGEIVALDVERGTCFGFNATASRIWALTGEPIARSALLDRLSAEFDVAPDDCARDVDALLASFRDRGIVRLDPAS